MFKKLCKVLAGLAVIGAACAAVYYFINKKSHSGEEDEFMDDFEDDFELDDDLGEVSTASREYVSLNSSADAAGSAETASAPEEDGDDEEDE